MSSASDTRETPQTGQDVLVTWEDHAGRLRERACKVSGSETGRFRVNLGGKNGHVWIDTDDDCWRLP